MLKHVSFLIGVVWVLPFIPGTTSSRSQDVPYYHLNRSFVPADFNPQENPPANPPDDETERLPGIVKGEPVKIDMSNTYAVERQAVVLGYESGRDAWQAATNSVMERRHPEKIFDNTGWICGVKSRKGKWGAYFWTLQNQIAFCSSATNWWEIKKGVRAPITNVMVGSLGNYPPMTNVVDIGPVIGLATNFPDLDGESEGIYQVDITNVFYQLMIPDLQIAPRQAIAAVGDTNATQFTATGTNIPKGASWMINPEGLAGGAILQVSNDWHFAAVRPGTVATNYKVRVTSLDITNFYAEAKLEVIKIDIMENNLYHDVSNTAALHLAPDSCAEARWEIAPIIKDGARFEGAAAGSSVVVNAGSIATNYLIKAYAARLTNCFDTCTVTVLNAVLVPDWNHDRTIDDSDKNRASASNPFRFWINDDADRGNISSGAGNAPGQPTGRFGDANYADDHVNGRADLLDFFPVQLNLKQTLDLLPPGKNIQYKLRQDDAALKAVYTGLTRDRAGAYLTTEGNVYGPSFKQNSSRAATFEITTSGVVLAEAFLNMIKDDETKGVLIMEGAKSTKKQLFLEIWKDGRKIHEKEMPLSIDGVEKMFRWLNLRAAAGGRINRVTDLNEPANYPDNLCNRKQFVFVHGYSVSEEGARAWNAEMFKRLYQSGSRAMFTAVTWFGNEGQIYTRLPWWLGGGVTPDYYANVVNAFESAPALAAAVNGLPGRKYIAGHSLGNMVVSSAIRQHRLNVRAYFMLNAAVAMEAFKETEIHPDQMRHPAWQDFNSRLWASEWHQLFGKDDGRHALTWRGLFRGIDNVVYNYYSSTEDVLDNGDGKLHYPLTTHRAWYNQEIYKGTRLTTGDSEGGWGFNDAPEGGYGTNKQAEVGGFEWRRLSPADAASLTDDQLRSNSFFRRFTDDELYGANGGAVAGNPAVKRRLLADAIPALSNPTGRNALDSFGNRNRNMAAFRRGAYKDGNWPDPDDRWRHSHIIQIAYPFNYAVFDQIVIDGGLQ